MDFSPDEGIAELRDLIDLVLRNGTTQERLRARERGGAPMDEALWQDIARSGALAAALPEDAGGMGYGIAAVTAIAEAQGRHVAPVPLWTSLVAARAVQRGGLHALAMSAAEGEAIIALALEETAGWSIASPGTRAESSPDGSWRLTGIKTMVAGHRAATQALVSATTPDGPSVFLIERGDDAAWAGAAWDAVDTTDLLGSGVLHLDRTPAVIVGDQDAFGILRREAELALAAVLIGVGDGALELAARYTSGREQFGRPIGSFQAVQQSLADCWIALDAARMTLLQALSDHDLEDPRASRSAAVASWWARRAAADTVYRAQHVHGGMGVDIDYPVHRYFLWGRQLSSTFGNEETVLERLGDDLALHGARS